MSKRIHYHFSSAPQQFFFKNTQIIVLPDSMPNTYFRSNDNVYMIPFVLLIILYIAAKHKHEALMGKRSDL